MACFIYKINSEKAVEIQKVANLNNEVSTLQSTVNNLNKKIDNVSNIINNIDDSNKENTIINTNTLAKNGINLLQFDTTFFKLEDIALEYMECSKITNYKDFEYDLDGDGKKDKITVKNVGKDELRK